MATMASPVQDLHDASRRTQDERALCHSTERTVYRNELLTYTGVLKYYTLSAVERACAYDASSSVADRQPDHHHVQQVRKKVELLEQRQNSVRAVLCYKTFAKPITDSIKVSLGLALERSCGYMWAKLQGRRVDAPLVTK